MFSPMELCHVFVIDYHTHDLWPNKVLNSKHLHTQSNQIRLENTDVAFIYLENNRCHRFIENKWRNAIKRTCVFCKFVMLWHVTMTKIMSIDQNYVNPLSFKREIVVLQRRRGRRTNGGGGGGVRKVHILHKRLVKKKISACVLQAPLHPRTNNSLTACTFTNKKENRCFIF